MIAATALLLTTPLACRAFVAPSPMALTFPPARRTGGSASDAAFGARSTRPAASPATPRGRAASATGLRSLRPLMEEIAAMAESNDEDAAHNDTPVIFVGGKGGVGKTSVSSALAVELASSTSLNVLIVSTDPAHSLGDALDVDLRPAAHADGARRQQPRPTTLTDPLTGLRLHALEVDPNAALAEFRANLELFDLATLSSSSGIPIGFLQDLGLEDLRSLINNPPPGLDELVALSNVLDPAFSEEYDVIVVDTAPTGHTLRMLQLPSFLEGFLSTLLGLQKKLKGLVSTLQMFMPKTVSAPDNPNQKLNVDGALAALEKFQQGAARLQQRLRQASSTKFVVVSIPTILSVRESQRLVGELVEQGICVSDVVINQCVGGGDADKNDNASGVSEATKRYYERRVAGQQRWMSELEEACAEVSASPEYASNAAAGGEGPRNGGIALTRVPFYDMELVGAPALGYLGSQTYFDDDNGFTRLIGCDQGDLAPESSSKNPKVVICGGKGGVGKTTTSSSLAIAMASAGHDVAVVSTDPAHSLGDALDMDLRGGSLVDVPLFGVAPPPMVPGGSPLTAGEGSLKAMEIDPTSALKEFRDSIDDLIGKKNDSDGSGNSELSAALNSLGEIIDTLPAGTDEVVALAEVVQLVKRNGFDRVVLDTAPTGHTLRMLTTPAFLADLIERVLSVAQKTSANPAVRALLSGVAASQNQKKEDVADAAESARAALLKFQVSMYDLEDLFADPASTEFLIVTIGTELAVRESVRLLNELTFGDPDMPIRVCNVVVNQVLDSGGGEEEEEEEKLRGFVTRLTRSQSSSIAAIQGAVDGLDNPPRVTKVTMLDMEPRGVYGLKALSEQLLLSEQTEVLKHS